MENFILFGALGIMIVFMFMNNKKRKKQADELQASIAVGSYVMLTSGIYGEVVAFDGDKVVIESTPSNKLTVNKLAIRQVEAAAPKPAKTAAKTTVSKKPAAKKPAAAKSAK